MHEAKMHETDKNNYRVKIFCGLCSLYIITCMCVTVDGVWIDE
jgi:hypothetical protein